MTLEREQQLLDLISTMMDRSALLEENVRLQKLLVAGPEEQIRRLESELARSNVGNGLLRQKLDLVLRRFFGKSCETLDPGQLELLLDGGAPGKAPASSPQGDAPEEANASSAARTDRKPRRERIPDHLPVVEEVLPAGVGQSLPGRMAQDRRGVQRELGLTARQDFHPPPRAARLREDCRPQRGFGDRRAAAPASGRPHRRTGAHCPHATSKYSDHLRYRQEKILSSRQGVKTGRNTMCR